MRKTLPEIKRGDTFTELTVLQYVGKDKWGKREYKVRCKCGNIFTANSSHLRQGNTTRCWECKNNARRNDLTGRRFHWAKVLSSAGHDKRGNSLSKCQCKCGTVFTVLNNSLLTGNTQSCGCLQRTKAAAVCIDRNSTPKMRRVASANGKLGAGRQYDASVYDSRATHGATRNGKWTPEYKAWISLFQRCGNHNGKAPTYADVHVCKRWTGPKGFQNFLSDMGRKPSPQHSLSRLADSGDYLPGNVVWGDRKHQVEQQRLKKRLRDKGLTNGNRDSKRK